MKSIVKALLCGLLLSDVSLAIASLRIDSLNSANAGLVPSIAIERQSSQRLSSRGPADALIRLGLRKQKSNDSVAAEQPATEQPASEPDAIPPQENAP